MLGKGLTHSDRILAVTVEFRRSKRTSGTRADTVEHNPHGCRRLQSSESNKILSEESTAAP